MREYQWGSQHSTQVMLIGFVYSFFILIGNDSMKHIGHRAIQAVFSSASLQTSTFKTQLGILLPPVITTLAASNTPANTLAKKYVDA